MIATATAGGLVFLSACDAGERPPERVEQQVVIALERARDALEEAGSALENVVKTFFLVRSLDDYAAVRRTETDFYETHAPRLVGEPPAATLMVVDSLGPPELLVAYEPVAALDLGAVRYFPEYWGGRKLAYPDVPKEHPKFARTEVVGNLVFVSGCQALNHDTVRVETEDFTEQTRVVLEKLRIGMEETESSLGNLVKTTVFLGDGRDYPRYRQVEREYFEEHAPELVLRPPASTLFHARGLPRPEFLVEVEAVGVVNRDDVRYVPGTAEAASAVSAGPLVFVSGRDGSGDDVEEQLTSALDGVRTTLEAAGASLESVLKLLVMVKRGEDLARVQEVERRYFERCAPSLLARPPASTIVQLPSITRPDALCQIEAIAALP